MAYFEESNKLDNLRSTISEMQALKRRYDSQDLADFRDFDYDADTKLRYQLGKIIKSLDKKERGEAALLFISRLMLLEALSVIKKGISPDAAKEALKRCTSGSRLEEPSLIDALLYEIPSVPANPESPALRFFARCMPRVAAAIATTGRGLKQDNPSFRYDLKDADYSAAAVACGSFLVMSGIAGTRPGNVFLAVSCGIISQLVSTIKTVHREGKIADVLAAPKKETVRSPIMD
jgi:hypothetical protein